MTAYGIVIAFILLLPWVLVAVPFVASAVTILKRNSTGRGGSDVSARRHGVGPTPSLRQGHSQ